MGTITIVMLFIAGLVIVFIWKGFMVVPQSTSVVIERLGKFHSLKLGGPNWIIPFIDEPVRIPWREAQRFDNKVVQFDRIRKHVDLREIPYDIAPQQVITKDNVSVTMDGLVYFQVVDPKRAVYEVTNVFQALEKLAQTSLRSLVGDMDLDDTLSGRDKINVEMQRILDEATDKWGLKVHRVEIQDIQPPVDVRQAMEKQMKAERERRATVTEAEGRKTSDILTSEGEMKKLENEALGRRAAVIAEAEAEKRSLELKGEGEASFILRIKEAVGDDNLVPYLLGIKYLEKIPDMFGGDNKVIVPYEAAGLMGSIKAVQHVVESVIKTNDGNGSHPTTKGAAGKPLGY